MMYRGVLMIKRHNRVVKMMTYAITKRLNMNMNELWLNLSLKTIEEADNGLGRNFLHVDWNERNANLRPDIAFWKKDLVKGRSLTPRYKKKL
jgi:hypothetical protein